MLDRVRSVSMNSFLEGGVHAADKSKNNLPEQDHWFTEQHGGGYPPDAECYSYDKLLQIGRHGPGPSDMIVFTDENADTIDDGVFLQYVESAGNTWENLAGTYHNRCDTLGFADGSAAVHKWTPGTSLIWVPRGSSEVESISIGQYGKTDMYWLYAHTTASFP